MSNWSALGARLTIKVSFTLERKQPHPHAFLPINILPNFTISHTTPSSHTLSSSSFYNNVISSLVFHKKRLHWKFRDCMNGQWRWCRAAKKHSLFECQIGLLWVQGWPSKSLSSKSLSKSLARFPHCLVILNISQPSASELNCKFSFSFSFMLQLIKVD